MILRAERMQHPGHSEYDGYIRHTVNSDVLSPSAEANYTAEEVEQAKQCFIIMNEEGKMRLTRNWQ